MKKLIFTLILIVAPAWMAQAADPVPATSTSTTPTPGASPAPTTASGTPTSAIPSTSSANPAGTQTPSPLDTSQTFLERYPLLKNNVFTEPNSNLYLGFSVGVLGVVRDRMFFSANFFQIHYIPSLLDWEVLSISYGTTTANPSYVQSNHFVFRTVPKLRLTNFLSVGPVFGYEYLSFPKINAVLWNGTYQTKTEPFSSSGMIYGLAASQNINPEKAYKLKITELVYQETYSTSGAGHGWSYVYDTTALRTDSTPIKAGIMALVEIGMIF